MLIFEGSTLLLLNAEYFCAVQVISCCTVYSCLLPLFYIDPVGRTWKRTYGKPKPSFASNVIPELLLTVLPSMLSRYPSYVHFHLHLHLSTLFLQLPSFCLFTLLVRLRHILLTSHGFHLPSLKTSKTRIFDLNDPSIQLCTIRRHSQLWHMMQ